MSTDVFLSVGRTFTAQQEQFVVALEAALRTHGLAPRTVGRSDFTSGAPLGRILDVLSQCKGTIVVAFTRSMSSEAIDRPGSPDESVITDVRLPTVWNQIEAAMSYAKGKPLLVVVEHGLRDEGLLEARYDWYVQWVDLDVRALHTNEFRGVLADWVKKVETYGEEPNQAGVFGPVAQASVKDIIGSLTVAQLWASLGAVVTVLAGVAAVAYRLGSTAAGG